MYTYNDFLAVADNSRKREGFIIGAIKDHERSELYKWAADAENYIRQKNTTIMEYTKLLYSISGKPFPDPYTSNHKTASNFFKRFVTQEIEYLLANGIDFDNESTKEKLGGAWFDNIIKKMAKAAVKGGACYGFWNFDHLEIFDVLEFIPLLDEEDGAMKAGIRFWQLNDNKPLRVTLYELDGYTDYKQGKKGRLEEISGKRNYIEYTRTSEIDGTEIYGGENYPTFPIAVLWGNDEHQSELVGLKTEIDAYDLIKSGFANDLEDVAQVYWLLQNAGGMDEVDIAQFLDRLKRLRVAQVDDDGANIQAQTIEVPYQARETYLSRLENDMYYDAMAMNAKDITAGNVTATAIRAAYDNLEHKANELASCIEEFILNIEKIAGIDEDFPIFKPNRISNDSEMTQNILASAQFLDTETILNKLPFIEHEEVEGILERLGIEEMSRYPLQEVEDGGQGENMDGQAASADGEETP